MAGIRGYLSKAHNGRYVFSRFPPHVQRMQGTQTWTLYPQEGDPWWFAPNDLMCGDSIRVQGLELEPLECIPVTWIMAPRGEKWLLEKETTYRRAPPHYCQHCEGQGNFTYRHDLMLITQTCPYCHGSGQAS